MVSMQGGFGALLTGMDFVLSNWTPVAMLGET
jgi:hypothetical protein